MAEGLTHVLQPVDLQEKRVSSTPCFVDVYNYSECCYFVLWTGPTDILLPYNINVIWQVAYDDHLWHRNFASTDIYGNYGINWYHSFEAWDSATQLHTSSSLLARNTLHFHYDDQTVDSLCTFEESHETPKCNISGKRGAYWFQVQTVNISYHYALMRRG